jgi:hypothetical protein
MADHRYHKKVIKKVSGVVAPSADWVTRLMKDVQKYFAKEKAKTKVKDTVRTKSIAKGLKTAGLTNAEIRKLRGKK